MSQIIAEALSKTYYVHERASGFAGWLRKKTKTVHALRDISFRIEQGEMVGYIGPNGAGKSTTVKILSGILVPDSGRCILDGRVPWVDRIPHVSRIGVVFGQRTQLWWDLPIEESFDLLRDMYRIPVTDYLPWRNKLVERLDLGEFLRQPVRQLSLGQRMRADLVAAMLHRPALLFLDEPTIGLDAVSKLAVRDFLRELNRGWHSNTPDVLFVNYHSQEIIHGDFLGLNVSRLHDAVLDDILNRARSSSDPVELQSLYSQAQKILVEDVPGVPSYLYHTITARKTYVKGVIADTSHNTLYLIGTWLDK